MGRASMTSLLRRRKGGSILAIRSSARRQVEEIESAVNQRSVISQRAGVYTDELSGPPPNAIALLARAFNDEYERRQFPFEDEVSLLKFELSNENIWKREASRAQVDAPWLVKIPYYVLCLALDLCFEGRPIARFFFLESVARMPYLSYLSLIHLYESLGLWRRSSEAKRVHFAQEWNEYHHLLLMESLGGDAQWRDRFLASHASIAYFWALVFLWFLSPSTAYKFSELIEAHAVDTYSEFLDTNAEILQAFPAPLVAQEYWGNATESPIFAEFHLNPVRQDIKCETLYDCFVNVRDDEKEHTSVAAACATPGARITPLAKDNSNSLSKSVGIGLAVTVAALAFAKYFGGGDAAAGDTTAAADSLEALDSVVNLIIRTLPFTL